MINVSDIIEIPRGLKETLYPKLLPSLLIALIVKGVYSRGISDTVLVSVIFLTLLAYFFSKVKLEQRYQKYIENKRFIEIINNLDALTNLQMTSDSVLLIIYGSLTTISLVMILLKLLDVVPIAFPYYILFLILVGAWNYIQFSKVSKHPDTVGESTELTIHKFARIVLEKFTPKLKEKMHYLYTLIQWLLWLVMPVMYGLIPNISMDIVIVHVPKKEDISKFRGKIESHLGEFVIHPLLKWDHVDCNNKIDIKNKSIWEWIAEVMEKGTTHGISYKYLPTQKAAMSVTCTKYSSYSDEEKTVLVFLLFGDTYIVEKVGRTLKLYLPLLDFSNLEYFAALSGLPAWCFTRETRERHIGGHY